MNDMSAIFNSWWMYLLGAIVTIFVLGVSIFFIIRAFKDAKELNMDRKALKKVIINSAVFTILPSISILIGVIALAGYIGIPLPWIRLSVIGALHYEGTAVDTVLDSFGVLAVENNQIFVTVALVMTLGIIVGPLFCLFGFEIYDKKVLSKTRNEANTEEATAEEATTVEINEEVVPEEKKKPKKDFGSMLFNAVFIAMVSVFLADDIAMLVHPEEPSDLGVYVPTSYVPTIVIAVTFLAMFVFDILEKKCKQKWLASFSLGLSMLIGMAAAAIVEWMVR